MISNPALAPEDLLKAILLKLGGPAGNGSKTLMLDQLQKILIDNAAAGFSTVLAVDEAHVIGNRETLDELRMLLNIQTDDEFLITLILLGQPPLLRNISELQPLKERISVKFNLEPLDLPNTLRYVLFRLKSAGATRGIPRAAIDLLCRSPGHPAADQQPRDRAADRVMKRPAGGQPHRAGCHSGHGE
jgi:general secretion pathway protein A